MRGNSIRRLAWLLSIILVALPLKAADDYLLRQGNAGLVRVGMSIDELLLKIDRKHTRLVDTSNEGFFTPTLQIFMPGNSGSKPSMEVEILCRRGNPVISSGPPPPWYKGTPWVVGRITVYDPRFHTANGFHVGSTLGEIKEKYPLYILTGEGAIDTFVESLGMTFGLDANQVPRAWYRTHNDALIPDKTKIISILVVR